jgi:hypothetical protein
MKKGRADLRSASAQVMTDENDADKENHTEQQPSGLTGPSLDATPTKRKDQRYTYNYIPPVPPLPKDLAATAAKVDRRLAKEIEKREARNRKSKVGSQLQSQPQPQPQSGKMGEATATATATVRQGSFNWPDDIF